MSVNDLIHDLSSEKDFEVKILSIECILYNLFEKKNRL